MNIFNEVRLDRYSFTAVVYATELTKEQLAGLNAQDSYNVEGEFTVSGLGEYHYRVTVNCVWVVDDNGLSIQLPESDTVDYTYLEDIIQDIGDPQQWYEDYQGQQIDAAYDSTRDDG